jgi:hypothetical protein
MKMEKKQKRFTPRSFGWGVSPYNTLTYFYYRYRQNVKNWGNMIVRRKRDLKYVFEGEVVINGKRVFKEKMPVKNFKEGIMQARKYLKKFPFKKMTKPYPKIRGKK